MNLLQPSEISGIEGTSYTGSWRRKALEKERNAEKVHSNRVDEVLEF